MRQHKPDPAEIAERLARAKPTVNGLPKKPSRAEQASIMFWGDPAIRRQLKMLAAETGRTQQHLLAEALNLLFAQHGKPPIA